MPFPGGANSLHRFQEAMDKALEINQIKTQAKIKMLCQI